MPLPVLQKVLGHSSIRTTALYWKTSQDPREKVISDKWLSGKIPQEPVKPIENKPQELPKLLEKVNSEEISSNTPENQNQVLREKIKELEWENNQHKKTIENLKSDKKRLEKQLIRVQKTKENLLKMLTIDLKQQRTLTQLDNNKQENNQELHQQLIAQIQVLAKY